MSIGNHILLYMREQDESPQNCSLIAWFPQYALVVLLNRVCIGKIKFHNDAFSSIMYSASWIAIKLTLSIGKVTTGDGPESSYFLCCLRFIYSNTTVRRKRNPRLCEFVL